MGTYGGPDIVTDGLIFALDTANKNSYPGSGTAINDLTVNNTNGTLTNGPTFNSGNAGTIAFDGGDDYIDFGSIISSDPLSLYGLNNFTIEVWVKANGTGDGFQRIIDKSSAGGAADGWGIWFGSTASTNYISLASAGSNLVTSTTSTDFGNWVHYVFTKSGNNYELWMNGVRKETNTNTTAIPSTTTNCRIGSWNHSTGRELNGEIATFRIYDTTLSATEVLQNYNATKTRFI